MKPQQGSIALLGTSADPPTYGHQALLKGLSHLFPKVVTWASDNPTKKHGASLEHRHDLLSALVKDIANPQLELVQELSSPLTINSLQKATELWPKAQLIFVIGSDLAEMIPHWAEVQEVLQIARIGIAPRKGWPLQKKQINLIHSLGGRIDFLPLNIPETASTEVRNKPELTQIPSSVLPILLRQNLYGLSMQKQ